MMNGYYDPADYDGLTDEEIAAMKQDKVGIHAYFYRQKWGCVCRRRETGRCSACRKRMQSSRHPYTLRGI